MDLPVIGALLLLMMGAALALPADERWQVLLFPVAWYFSRMIASSSKAVRERLIMELKREVAPKATILLQIEALALIVVSLAAILSSESYSPDVAIMSILILAMVSFLMFWMFPWSESSLTAAGSFKLAYIPRIGNTDVRLQVCSLAVFALMMGMLFISAYFYGLIGLLFLPSLFESLAVLAVLSLKRWPWTDENRSLCQRS